MGTESVSKQLEKLTSSPALKDKPVTVLSAGGLIGFLQETILNRQDQTDEPFHVLDLGVVESLHETWTTNLPMVQPFYAVKCNAEPALLGAMAALGSGFDCASRSEIESVLALGVPPARIVYANPCKAESHVKYAASVGVKLTAFDSLEEVKKIQKLYPEMELLIRIKPPEDGEAKNPLDAKFGALPDEIEPLLSAAQTAGLAVVGVCFHIGSGATNWGAYRAAIAMAAIVFETASRLGMPPLRILNMGGGFNAGPGFKTATKMITTGLRDYFQGKEGMLTVMAEPGRYFSETAFILAACIIGKRVRAGRREYMINDGAYGSLNCVFNDQAVLSCEPLACASNPGNPTCLAAKTYDSKVFGPTLDAADTVVTGQMLPELEINDWVVFRNRGAYSVSCGTSFNGFDTAAMAVYVVFSTTL